MTKPQVNWRAFFGLILYMLSWPFPVDAWFNTAIYGRKAKERVSE